MLNTHLFNILYNRILKTFPLAYVMTNNRMTTVTIISLNNEHTEDALSSLSIIVNNSKIGFPLY